MNRLPVSGEVLFTPSKDATVVAGSMVYVFRKDIETIVESAHLEIIQNALKDADGAPSETTRRRYSRKSSEA